MGDEPTYSFKEFWQDRFDRFERMVSDDLKEIKADVKFLQKDFKADVKALQEGQDAQGRSLENIKGKMIVYGIVFIIVGTAIASFVVKLSGP